MNAPVPLTLSCAKVDAQAFSDAPPGVRADADANQHPESCIRRGKPKPDAAHQLRLLTLSPKQSDQVKVSDARPSSKPTAFSFSLTSSRHTPRVSPHDVFPVDSLTTLRAVAYASGTPEKVTEIPTSTVLRAPQEGNFPRNHSKARIPRRPSNAFRCDLAFAPNIAPTRLALDPVMRARAAGYETDGSEVHTDEISERGSHAPELRSHTVTSVTLSKGGSHGALQRGGADEPQDRAPSSTSPVPSVNSAKDPVGTVHRKLFRSASADSGVPVPPAAAAVARVVAARRSHVQSVVVVHGTDQRCGAAPGAAPGVRCFSSAQASNPRDSSEARLSTIFDSLLSDMATLKEKMRVQEQAILNSVNASSAHGIAIKLRRKSVSVKESAQSGIDSAHEPTDCRRVSQCGSPPEEKQRDGTHASGLLRELAEIKLDVGDFRSMHSTLASAVGGANLHCLDSARARFVPAPASPPPPPTTSTLPALVPSQPADPATRMHSTHSQQACDPARGPQSPHGTDFAWQPHTHGRISYAPWQNLTHESCADELDAVSGGHAQRGRSGNARSHLRRRNRPARASSGCACAGLRVATGTPAYTCAAEESAKHSCTCGPFKKCVLL